VADEFYLFQNHWWELVLPITVLDNFSRHINTWKLFTSMTVSYVKEILDESVSNIGMNHVQVKHRPSLLSDNNPYYNSGKLKTYLRKQGIKYTRGAPYHSMNKGKVERSHRFMKIIVKLQSYYFPWELE
jgi:transposase InsO family protein